MFHLTCLLLAAVQAAVQAPSDATPPATLCWGDYTGDGLADVLALRGGAPRLLENLGQGEFADASLRAGLPELAGVRQAVWQDSDGDGDLDLLLVAPAQGLHLLRNDAGRFSDVTAQAGLAGLRGVARADFLELDGDALPDLWLAGPDGDRLLRQQVGGAFAAVDLELPDAPSAQVDPSVAADATDVADAEPARTASSRESAPDGARLPVAGGAASADARRDRAAATGGVVVSDVTSGPTLPGLGCSPRLLDTTTGSCLTAASLPTFGSIYPLGMELNIDAAGRVGMGTAAPSHRLTIQGVGSDDLQRWIGTQGSWGHGARLNLGDADYVHLWEYEDDKIEVKGDKGVWLRADNGNVVANGDLFQVVSGASQFLQGNVGIGPITPAWPLDVYAPQAVARLQTSTSGNGSVLELRSHVASPTSIGAINFVNAAGQFNGQIAYTGGDDLALRAGGAERMRLDAGGNVGVGTANPSRKLEVAGGATSAIHGHTTAVDGDGVFGLASSTGTGSGFGVRGQSNTIGGKGVYGLSTADSGVCFGVLGSADSRDGFGVKGMNFAQPTTGSATVTGVYGEVFTRFGQGVWGKNWDSQSSTFNPVGVLGTGWSTSNGFGVFAEGRLGATGTKSFVQPIPGDPTRMLQFVCLEGNEAGTYCRGQEALSGGVARIPIPLDFRLATSPDGMTAQVTPRGPALVYVESVTLDELVVRGSADVPFDWTVNGVRRAFEDVETIVDNSVFIPRVRGVPYMPGASAEYRRLLVEAGITNADGTPNEATAASRGVELLDPEDPRAQIWLPPQMRTGGDRAAGATQAPAPAEPAAPPLERGD